MDTYQTRSRGDRHGRGGDHDGDGDPRFRRGHGRVVLGRGVQRSVEGASLTEGAVMAYTPQTWLPSHPLIGRVVTWKEWRAEADENGNFVKETLIELTGEVLDVRVSSPPGEHRRDEGWYVLVEETGTGLIIERLADGLILAPRPRIIPKDAIRV